MSDEPTIDQVSRIGDAMVKHFVAKAQALQPDGCCSGPWRGHLCQYHMGYRDGLEDMYAKLLARMLGDEPTT